MGKQKKNAEAEDLDAVIESAEALIEVPIKDEPEAKVNNEAAVPLIFYAVPKLKLGQWILSPTRKVDRVVESSPGRPSVSEVVDGAVKLELTNRDNMGFCLIDVKENPAVKRPNRPYKAEEISALIMASEYFKNRLIVTQSERDELVAKVNAALTAQHEADELREQVFGNKTGKR